MNWLGRLNKGLDNDQSLCSATKLVTYAVRGKMPPEVDRLPSPEKTKNQKRYISWWGQSPTGGLLRIVYAVTWLVVVMWPLFTKHANIYCGWTWCAVETSAANLSNSKLGNSNLVLILKGGKGQGELWLKVHTTILPYKNNLLNRQNNHTTAILTKTSLFSLYTTLYPRFTKHQQKISRHVYGGQPRYGLSLPENKQEGVWWWCKSVERDRESEGGKKTTRQVTATLI